MSEDGPGPNVRRRQLGRELRKLREKADMTLKEAAKFAGLTSTTISRIEGGKQTILTRNVRLLCQCYEVGASMLDTLIRLAEESNERGWWTDFSDSLPDWFESFVGLESDAEEVWRYSPNFIDGLLQTPEYAAAFLELVPKATEKIIKQQVDFRRARQDRVNREDSPTKLRVVLDEAALRRTVGGVDAMRDQIGHLVELAERPNITIQVVPFDAGAYLGMQSPFHLLRFAEGFDDMDAVYLENQRGAIWMERPTDIKYYIRLFERMTEVALAPDETADFMDSLASSL
ncbi:helix-turn-helix transcriptional regulator [Saccharopolyspora sp. NPDC050389]|uniref:helix-turn-helix domain-containing protein n=1 Tax=Saccharopolyspora sp. NPDC050389 TaxID=3155516 RepID=UPI0033C1FE4A